MTTKSGAGDHDAVSIVGNIDDLSLDRNGMAVLDYASCWRLIGSTPVGRLAFIDAGEIIVVPVNHGLDGHTIVFRTAGGQKLDAAIMERTATFEADSWDATTRSGWSVLVRGWVEEETDPDAVRWLEELGLEPWADAVARPRWIRVRPEDVSGRVVAARPDRTTGSA